MKIHLLFICTICFIISGCNNVNGHYAGYITDESGLYLPEVLVREYRSDGRSIVTDSKGFFKLERERGIICNLIFEKEGYRSDTILTFRMIDDDNTEYCSTLTSDTTKIILQRVNQ